ncbi:RNA-binding protein [Desulfoluna sp.]|uniref:RNA recognition motif domain-containing protein n=1 Tax=Desulfoluna sp. TaxID=2045199 RepID=UPI002637D50C|nr:RNA-binding protein [Desulfoluna sp.]
MKLLVRNLNRATTEAELLEIFTEHGLVETCDLVIDKENGQSKGFGFVEMPKTQEAKAAIKKIDGAHIAGNKVRVKMAE